VTTDEKRVARGGNDWIFLVCTIWCTTSCENLTSESYKFTRFIRLLFIKYHSCLTLYVCSYYWLSLSFSFSLYCLFMMTNKRTHFVNCCRVIYLGKFQRDFLSVILIKQQPNTFSNGKLTLIVFQNSDLRTSLDADITTLIGSRQRSCVS